MQTPPDFTIDPGHDHVAASTTAGPSHLSGPLTALAGSAFVSGAVYGLLQFLQRSPVRQRHVAGTAAWGPQLALALAAIAILSFAWWRRQRGNGPRPGRRSLLVPLGTSAARRIARVLGLGGDSAQPGRFLLALPAAALLGYCVWRAGVQVTGGLDPNFTVNAWGGPSYAGALACHYLDLALLGGAAAWLLDRILPA
ncbi:MAG TPA: hypothetical protein VK823_26405 [Streptosporangiaceae bacterium]|jgi:hypothetical protein|nr:hypothetical protein [Streptosporangiaceae bacterium]